MFDDAGIAYPDDTWDWDKLVEVGKQLTKDTNGDGTPDQWGVYTETTDMENAWSSFVWQAGGDILTADGTKSALDSDQSAQGIQFLQDLIWKEKASPDPAIFAETGDAFEQGVAAMEINGSWLVPTHEAAGLDFGSRHCRRARRAGDVGQPDGGGRLQGHAVARGGVGARQVPRQPRGPGEDHGAQGVGAGQQGDPQHDLRERLRRCAGLRRRARLRHLKPSFKGYNEFTTVLQTELDENVFNTPNKTAKDAIASVNDQLNQILADNQ